MNMTMKNYSLRQVGVKALCALTLALGIATAATAGGYTEEVNLVEFQNRYMSAGEDRSAVIPGGWRFVEGVRFNVSSDYGANLEVWVNGSLKRRIYVYGNEPNGWVSVNETARTVELRNSGSYAIRVQYLGARVERQGYPVPPIVQPFPPSYPPSFPSGSPVLPGLPSTNVATWLAKRAIEDVDNLRDYVDPETEYVRYLLPVKTVAGTTYSVAASSGDLSDQTKVALRALSQQLYSAQPLINILMRRQDTFDRAVELQALYTEILNRLR